jgi:hypothetical protein
MLFTFNTKHSFASLHPPKPAIRAFSPATKKIDAGSNPQPPKLRVLLTTNRGLCYLRVFPSLLAGFKPNLRVPEQPNPQLNALLELAN